MHAMYLDICKRQALVVQVTRLTWTSLPTDMPVVDDWEPGSGLGCEHVLDLEPACLMHFLGQGIFRVKSMFIGANVRKATNDGRADYLPVFLSETPLLFRRKHVDLDVAMVQV